METRKLHDDENGISAAAEILKNGGIVAIPTETVYGLAASSYDENAVKNVFLAKGRPQDNPLIVHISDMKMLSNVVSEVPPAAKVLAEKFWPGPLTIIMPRNEKIPRSVSAGLDTVAVRMPSNPVAHAVIEKSGLPLAAPSANLSGKPSPTAAFNVVSDLDGKIDAVIMSTDCAVGVESTVVSLTTNPPRLLRPGGVTAEELLPYLPDLIIDKAVLSKPDENKPVASPGMKYKHYAPNTEVVMIEASSEDFVHYVNRHSDCGALCFDDEYDKIICKKIAYGNSQNDNEQAEKLFSALRSLDTLGVKKVFAHAPEKSGVGLAVYNRLIRAAAFRVVTL